MTVYLSRLRIARQPQIAALAALLNPKAESQRMDAHHRLLWSAFTSEPDTRRDFLWRYDGRDGFLVLSARKPGDSPLFEPPQVREFAPQLIAGDRLAFALRANATRTQATGRTSASGKPHKAHIDLVMDALHPLQQGRAQARMDIAQDVATSWMTRQGQQHGFVPEQVIASDYRVLEPSVRARRGRSRPRFGVLELEGVITVTEPTVFLARLPKGFGRAKAFGCGLMLIRRT